MELNLANINDSEIEFTRQEIKVLNLASDGYLNTILR
jgi:hypothetical protein